MVWVQTMHTVWVYDFSVHLRSFILIISRFRDESGVRQWRVFSNKNSPKSSPTTPFRRHLEDHHTLVWVRECARLNIPVKHPAQEPTPDVLETEPFTKAGLSRHIVKFVSNDDQVRPLPVTFGGYLLTEM